MRGYFFFFFIQQAIKIIMYPCVWRMTRLPPPHHTPCIALWMSACSVFVFADAARALDERAERRGAVNYRFKWKVVRLFLKGRIYVFFLYESNAAAAAKKSGRNICAMLSFIKLYILLKYNKYKYISWIMRLMHART